MISLEQAIAKAADHIDINIEAELVRNQAEVIRRGVNAGEVTSFLAARRQELEAWRAECLADIWRSFPEGQQLLAIEQVDAILCEDRKMVLLMGHTSNPDVTFIQSVSLPLPIDEDNFDHRAWRHAAKPLAWRLA